MLRAADTMEWYGAVTTENHTGIFGKKYTEICIDIDHPETKEQTMERIKQETNRNTQKGEERIQRVLEQRGGNIVESI